jgi:predicted O-methyltransferase YrrM
MVLKKINNFFRSQRHARRLNRYFKFLAAKNPDIDWDAFIDITKRFDGKSLSTSQEQALLYELSHGLPENGIVVEIGSWIGHSTCLLGTGLRGPKARLYAIDAFCALTADAQEKKSYLQFMSKRFKGDPTQRDVFDENIARYHLQEKVVPISYPSDQAAEKLDLPPRSADLLFIDGGHTLDVVRRDIALYLPFVKPGGLVCFHDFGGCAEVTQAVWEEVTRGTFPTYVGHRDSLLVLKTA